MAKDPLMEKLGNKDTADFEKEIKQSVAAAENGTRFRPVEEPTAEGTPKPLMSLAEALNVKPDDPRYGDARSIVGMNCIIRNKRTKPEVPLKMYLVGTVPNSDGVSVIPPGRQPVAARNKLHAIAVQNDLHPVNAVPGPMGRLVVEVEAVDGAGMTDEDIRMGMSPMSLVG